MDQASEGKVDTIRLALAGDVMLGRLVNEAIQEYGPTRPWGDVLSLLLGADLRHVNLECVIAEDGTPWTPKVFHFRADPEAVDVLTEAHIDCVSLANNHILDFHEGAVLETLELLDNHGIARAGAGRNAEEAARPAIIEAGGIKVGIVSFTDNEPDWGATFEGPGVRYLSTASQAGSVLQIRSSIEQARAQGADVILVSAHWGPNMRRRPTLAFRQFARAVMDQGADIFQGHSAHLFQGIEIYKGKPILYDTGDFLDDYAVDPALRNDEAFLFVIEVSTEGARRIDLYPALISNLQVNRAQGNDFERIIEKMRQLCSEMGTTARLLPDRLQISVAR